MFVDEEIAGEALERLRKLVDVIADAKAAFDEADNVCERTRALVLISLGNEGTVSQRQAQVALDPRVEEAEIKRIRAGHALEIAKGRQRVCEIEIDAWRTASANQRRG